MNSIWHIVCWFYIDLRSIEWRMLSAMYCGLFIYLDVCSALIVSLWNKFKQKVNIKNLITWWKVRLQFRNTSIRNGRQSDIGKYILSEQVRTTFSEIFVTNSSAWVSDLRNKNYGLWLFLFLFLFYVLLALCMCVCLMRNLATRFWYSFTRFHQI